MDLTEQTGGERTVWIEGPSGPLFGILHSPASPDERRICIIMLNAGMQSRTGPERLYVRAARRFAEAGISVLRVDLSGCGDSFSDNRETHFDSHRVADVAAALDYVRRLLEPDALLLLGLCAGARVALKAAATDPSVDGVVAWSSTILTAARNMPRSPEAPADGLSEVVIAESRDRLARFVREMKWLRPRWWKKRLGGNRSLAQDAALIGRSLVKRRPGIRETASTFIESVERYVAAERKVSFVYGERDRISLTEFRSRFPRIECDPRQRQSYTVVAGGSHSFSTIRVQDDVAGLALAWLRVHFPVATSGPPQHLPR